MQNDPSLSSYYVGNQFYETLVKSYTNWQTEESEILDFSVTENKDSVSVNKEIEETK